MPLEQLAVELHHLLVLSELQQALAQVESQWEAHLLQRIPVVGLLINLRSAQRGQGGWAAMDAEGNVEQMKRE